MPVTSSPKFLWDYIGGVHCNDLPKGKTILRGLSLLHPYSQVNSRGLQPFICSNSAVCGVTL